MKGIRQIIVAVETQKSLRILSLCCSLSYPACKEHEPYYIVICGLYDLYHIFPPYLVKYTIFRKNLLNVKYGF